jgi:putative spermidine/putrescine transport system substrate-binding protein
MSTIRDQLRRLADDFAAHRISRREFSTRVVGLGLSAPMLTALLSTIDTSAATLEQPTLLQPSLAAQENTLVISSWGGNYGEQQRKVQFDPFIAETGIEIVLASQTPELALVEAQVTSGNVEWDLFEPSSLGAYTLAGRDLLEPIDYSKMDQAIVDGIDEPLRGEYSVGLFYYAQVLAWNETFFDGVYPQDWAEFWDVERFPAPRALTGMDYEPPPLEIPLLAQGIAPEDLYPLDIEAAFSSLDEIRPYITKWTGYSIDADVLLVQGEVGLTSSGSSNIWHAQNDGQPVDWTWNQGVLQYDVWAMPKGAPHQDNAYRFMEFCCRPEIQAGMVNTLAIGAANPAAYEFVPDEVAAASCTAPDNAPLTVKADTAWWTTKNAEGKTNLDLVYKKWAEWIL